MSEAPIPPEPTETDSLDAREERFRPHPWQFVIGLVLMFVWHWIRNVPLPAGLSMQGAVVSHAVANVMVTLLMTAVFRMLKQIRWTTSLFYSATICGGMFAGDMLSLLLLGR